MGAFNHNQNLYRARPWELKKNIIFDIFSIETPLSKIEVVRNMVIIRINPLMIIGYRFLLNDITRYSYMFFNYKSLNNINLKINNIANICFNWIQLINFLQFILIYCVIGINLIVMFVLNYESKNKYKNFLNLFLTDTIDLLNLKNLFKFNNRNFGFSFINFTEKVKLNLINKLDKCCLKKKVYNFDNILRLDLDITRTLNFYLSNFNNIIQEISIFNKSNFNYIHFFLFLNSKFKFLIKSELEFKENETYKVKNFIDLYFYLLNKVLYKKVKISFFGNLANFVKLNLNKLVTSKWGTFFFNNNIDLNLNFLGYKKFIEDLDKNFSFIDFLYLIDISSFINWKVFLVKKLKKFKTFNFNFKISRNNEDGLNVPVNSILSLKNCFFNIFGRVVTNFKILHSKMKSKPLSGIFKIINFA